MKTCALVEPGRIDIVDRPEPRSVEDYVKVQVEVIPMCTEFRDRRSGKLSDAIGHEAAGVVVDPGASDIVGPGDRVVVMPNYGCGRCALCQAGDHIYCPAQRDVERETGQRYATATYAEFLLKPDWLLLKVPDGLSLRLASLACCALGPGLNAVERLAVGPTDTVLVSGCGPVGLGVIVNALRRGARVAAFEPHHYRAELARLLGAETVLDPRSATLAADVRDLVDNQATCGVETSGIPDGAARLLEHLAPLGRLALLAWETPVNLPPLVPRGTSVHGCWHWNHLRHADLMWATIADSAERLDLLITHEFALEEVSDAMDLQESGACGKVLLHTGHGLN